MGNTYTKAQAAATKKYLKNIGEYKLRVSKEDKEKYMDFAKSCGMSLNTFIIQAVEEKIEREGIKNEWKRTGQADYWQVARL